MIMPSLIKIGQTVSETAERVIDGALFKIFVYPLVGCCGAQLLQTFCPVA